MPPGGGVCAAPQAGWKWLQRRSGIRRIGATAAVRYVTTVAAATLSVALVGTSPAQATPSILPVAASGGPTVDALVPARGPASGGTSVRITGTGFDGTTVVRFNGVPAPSFDVETGQDGTVLDVIVPPHAAGPAPVTVTTPIGTSHAGPAGTFAYQAVHGRWTSLAAPRRSSHTATLLPDGRVLVAGGCVQPEPSGQCSKATATAEIYDPAHRSFARTASMTTARIGHVATLLADGRVLVSGGCATLNCGAARSSSERSAELYDPAAGRWTKTGGMVFVQHHPTATVLPSGPASVCGSNCGKVLVVGTATALDGTSTPTDAELYDPRTGTWAPTATTEHTRDYPTSVLLGTGKVLVASTVSDLPSTTAVPAELYDPAMSTWTPTGNAEPSPETTETMTLLPDGRVLAVASDLAVKKGVELYDPTGLPDPANPAVKGGVWSSTAKLTVARFGNVATRLHDGNVLVTGGEGVALGEPPTPPLGTAELYNEKAAAFTSAATMAGGRAVDPVIQTGRPTFTATLLPDGAVLVVGVSYRVGSLDTYFKTNQDVNVSNPAAYGPSAELYTPAGVTGGSSSTPLFFGLGVGAAVVLIALSVVVQRRRRSR